MKIAVALLALSALFAPFGTGQTKPKGALDKATLEAYLRHVELYRTEVTYKIDDPKPAKNLPHFYDVVVHVLYDGGSRDQTYQISEDGQHIVSGDIYTINKSPFQANLDKLTTADQPTFGAADAAITIVEFGDLECPDCRMEAPLLRKNVPETFGGKVRVFFKDFPLESIHPWARAAAIAGRCVYHQNADTFWKFYDWIYDNQQEIEPGNLTAKVVEWAGQNGLDTAKLSSCIDTKATEPEVNRSIAEGQALALRGTPTLFINGRKIGGLQWPDLQLVINNELKYLSSK